MAHTLNYGNVISKTKMTRSGIQQIKHTYDFSGDFVFKGTMFTYEVNIAPFSSGGAKNMKKILLNRKDPTDPTRSKICLDLTKEDVKKYANNTVIQTSAFFIVYAQNKLDSGSGTLQVYNHCSAERVNIDNAQAWINDVCRSYPVGIEKSKISPVEAMFYLMEQLVVKNLKKSETHLMVSIDNQHVIGIYEKYGYQKIPDLPVCYVAFDKGSGDRKYFIMNKSGLKYDGLINDELFNIESQHTSSSHTINLTLPTQNTIPKKNHGGNKRQTKTLRNKIKTAINYKIKLTKKSKRSKIKY